MLRLRSATSLPDRAENRKDQAADRDQKVSHDRNSKANGRKVSLASKDKASDKVEAEDSARVGDKDNVKAVVNKEASARVVVKVNVKAEDKARRDALKVRGLKVADNDLLNKAEGSRKASPNSRGLRSKVEVGNRKVRNNSRLNREDSQATVRQDRRHRNRKTKMSLLSILIVVLIAITRPSLSSEDKSSS